MKRFAKRLGLTLVFAFAIAGAGGCGDDDPKPTGTDDAAPADIDAGTAATPSGLDRPELPRPPTGGLPADLRPPTPQ